MILARDLVLSIRILKRRLKLTGWWLSSMNMGSRPSSP